MKIIVCLDDRNGMLFNKRRQSSDRLVCQRVIELVGDGVLWMNAYSQPLFDGLGGNICVDDAFMMHAGQDDYCFVEDLDVKPYIAGVSEVIIFRWGRIYPSDLRFSAQLLLDGWKQAAVTRFEGNSHDTITQEVYRR